MKEPEFEIGTENVLLQRWDGEGNTYTVHIRDLVCTLTLHPRVDESGPRFDLDALESGHSVMLRLDSSVEKFAEWVVDVCSGEEASEQLRKIRVWRELQPLLNEVEMDYIVRVIKASMAEK